MRRLTQKKARKMRRRDRWLKEAGRREERQAQQAAAETRRRERARVAELEAIARDAAAEDRRRERARVAELEAIARDADAEVERAEQARKPRWTEDARRRAGHRRLAVLEAVALLSLAVIEIASPEERDR